MADITTTVANVATTAGFSTSTTLPGIIGNIIHAFLAILGVVFLILVIYAGWLWMTAQGDPKKVEKAQSILTNGVIGLVIILSAYGITTWVVNLLTGGINGNTNTNGRTNGVVSTEYLSGSLGRGPIRDHYPERNQTDVARNTSIIVTFKDAMDIGTIIKDYDTRGTPDDVSDDVVPTDMLVNVEAVKIYSQEDGETAALSAVHVSFSDDLRTFVFYPDAYLGSPTEDVSYEVFLDTSLRNTRDELVFSGDDAGGYLWSFQTGTSVDTEPPHVVSVLPADGGQYAKNIAIQMTFSEAVDPTTVSGVRNADGSGFSDITVASSVAPFVPGTFALSNGYRTVSFVTSSACGTNSCGDTVYCLPGNERITVTVSAADIGANPPQATVPYTGVADISGNALDGDDDGTAGDDYLWDFQTTGDIRLDGPGIESISPSIFQESVPLDQNVEVVFSDVMLSSTLNSESITLRDQSTEGENHDLWYRLGTSLVAEDGSPVSSGAAAARTVVTIDHGTFLESSETASWLYGVEVNQDVQNEYQNCFIPAYGPTNTGATCAVSQSQPYCCNGSPAASACDPFAL
jgi:hypothetical protein